jgi:DNA-binding phage protein
MTFEDAFHEINGRRPTHEEVKHALALRRIVKEADLDPILLMYVVDAQAQAARARGLAEIAQATTQAVEKLQKTLPSIAEAERSIGALQGVQTALQGVKTLLSGARRPRRAALGQ